MTFAIIGSPSKDFYTFLVYVEAHVPDPCMVLIKPRFEETEKICINYKNRPNYVYPYASILHPECTYNMQL